jgi:SAM-dependent methyltransferase
MLDVFTPLDDGPKTPEELTQKIQCDNRALTMLLNALAAMGLLVKSGEHYSLSSLAKEFLVKHSPRYMGYIIRHHHRLMSSWAMLPQTVRTGQPTRGQRRSDDDREDFLLGMFNLASGIAPGLAKNLDLTGRERLLDLGGGPGTYAIHFCLENPVLRATVFDMAGTKRFAEATISRFGVGDRVEFVAGDYHHDPLPGGYDVAWLSHILHAEGPEGCRNILAKAAKALKPGGLLLVHEFILRDAMDGPLFPALFSLNMLLGTQAGQSYSEAQLKDMLAGVGARDIRRLDFAGPNDSGIIQGVVG